MQTATPWLDQLAIIWDLPAGFLLCLALGSACAWILHLVIDVRALRSETGRVTRRALGLAYLTDKGRNLMPMDDFAIMTARPGETVDDFAARMLAQSQRSGLPILGEHNQHTLEARPEMSTREILAPWHESQRRNYLGLEN